MLPFNARNNTQGFTLAETAVIAVIIGILAAIAIPSFLGWLNKKKVEDALVTVQGALQEAQREAIKRSRRCRVDLDIANNDYRVKAELLNASNNVVAGSSCLATGDRDLCERRDPSNGNCLQPPKIAISTGVNGSRITFSFRGNTANGGTTVLYMPDGSTQEKRCLVTSVGIGIMRTGVYSGDPSTPSAGTCNTSRQGIQ